MTSKSKITSTKKTISLALALVLIATLFTACGNKEKPAVSPDSSSNTLSSTTETGAVVPSIEGDEETTESTTTANAGTATANAGKDDKNNQSAGNSTSSDRNPSSGKPAQKPVTTTKPSGGSSSSDKKPTTTRPAETTTKPAPKPETTTKPSTPSGNTYAYFRASTGERIKYLTYRGDLDQARCTGISESNGKITATYDIGASEEWWKCDNCGKYLCEGCQPITPECPFCGKVTCVRYGNDGTCYYCDQFVKGKTCHDCPKSPRR